MCLDSLKGLPMDEETKPAAGAGCLRVAVFSREPDWAAPRLRLSTPLGALSK